MEQGRDGAPIAVAGHPTDEELTALVVALRLVATASPPERLRPRPRVWPRTSWRSHDQMLRHTLPEGTHVWPGTADIPVTERF